MRFLLKTIAIGASTYFIQLHLHLPWYSSTIAPFLFGALIKSPKADSFFEGFLGIFGLWFYMTFTIDLETNSILTNKIAQVFQVNSNYLIIFIASIIGGTCGGWASLTGRSFRKVFQRKKSSYYYK